MASMFLLDAESALSSRCFLAPYPFTRDAHQKSIVLYTELRRQLRGWQAACNPVAFVSAFLGIRVLGTTGRWRLPYRIISQLSVEVVEH